MVWPKPWLPRAWATGNAWPDAKWPKCGSRRCPQWLQEAAARGGKLWVSPATRPVTAGEGGRGWQQCGRRGGDKDREFGSQWLWGAMRQVRAVLGGRSCASGRKVRRWPGRSSSGKFKREVGLTSELGRQNFFFLFLN